MNKLIYMENTLNLLAQKNLEATQKLVAQGTVRQINEVKYLVIEE